MMSGAKKMVPKRRFKEFLNAGDWEQRKLSEIVTINPKTELPDEFKYVDLESVVGTNLLGFQVIKKENAPSRAQRLASYGDVFYQTVRPYQRNNYLFENVDKDMVFSTGYAQLRSKLDSYFLLTLVQNNNFVKVVLDNCTGTSYPAINRSELGKIIVQIPSNEVEANQIGKVFRGIDKSITLHQRKLDKLQATKKALLQEMFPEEGQDKPKRRFKGFTDAWEQRKLGECMNSFAYGLNAAAKNYDGMHKYIRITDIDDETHNFIQSNLTSPDIDFNMDVSDYKLNVGDIVFARTGASVGKTYLYNPNDGDLYYAGFLIRGKVKEDCDAGFIYQNTLTKEYDSFIRITSQRSGQPGVNSKEYATFRLNIPCKDEQEKISKVLNSLDELFTLHQRKLDKLKNLKRAYLNELFV